MRLRSLTALQVRIPLRRTVKHASHARVENDTLLVRAETADGTVGWGEGLPREYVTGETIASCFQTLAETDFQPLTDLFGGLTEALGLLDEFHLPAPPPGQRDAFGNTVRCAVELAILDAAAQADGVPLSQVTHLLPAAAAVRQQADRVRYGVAITATKPWKETVCAAAYHLYGFRQIKVKVGLPGQEESASLSRIRRSAGAGMDLRIDANEGWPVPEVAARVAALRPLGITAVEQPVRHDDVAALAALRPTLGVPIMLDESLCSLADARRAVDDGLCDLFNLRLSKCGGFVNCLKLAALAHAAGLGCQLGCMVGETGILSAAGRHFACSVAGLRYLEGSFDRHLVREPLTTADLTFARGGLAPALTAPGLGVRIDAAALRRVTQRQVELL